MGEVYAQYRDRIQAFFARRLADADLAQDLMQDVFAAAVARKDALAQDGRDPWPWLRAVAEHLYVDELRTRERHRIDGAEWIAERVVESSEDDARGALLADGMRALPQEQREVVIGHLVQGWSFAEIGSELDRSEGACRMSFFRGRKNLRRFLLAAGAGGASH
jgi:RNA polymerase sigma factor (sigma-70 family)